MATAPAAVIPVPACASPFCLAPASPIIRAVSAAAAVPTRVHAARICIAAAAIGIGCRRPAPVRGWGAAAAAVAPVQPGRRRFLRSAIARRRRRTRWRRLLGLSLRQGHTSSVCWGTYLTGTMLRMQDFRESSFERHMEKRNRPVAWPVTAMAAASEPPMALG